ncbi:MULTISPECIES: hypothetical protein [unclassified Mucilaginibacter]|uniref:hypothetical protein n=1 Tax=unclassified Mucilaginibacter TaxID=2617802 RepID=UPI0031F69F4A
MDERFLLEVIYNGEVLKYDAEFRNYGYVQKVAVDLDGLIVFFEPDEEGSYRALINPEQLSDKNNKLEIGLLQAIALRLQALQA